LVYFTESRCGRETRRKRAPRSASFARIAADAFLAFSRDDGWAIASHIALSTLMSLFPFLIFVTALTGYFGTQDLADQVALLLLEAWPEEVSGPIASEIESVLTTAHGGLLTVGAGLAALVMLQPDLWNAVTLLVLTPLLYHLPQAVLAAVIIMAVIGLINFGAIKHAWQANRHDGIAAVVTFVATLAFAPHLDNGIMVGAGLAIGLYLYRTMSPRVAILGRYQDGTLRDARVHNLPASDTVTAVRFDGRLYFANVAYFEDAILEAVAANPKARYLLVVGDGINELDASGEEVIHHLVARLHGNGVTVMFSGLKKQVLDVMRATGLFEAVTQANIFATADQALQAIYAKAGASADADALRPVGA